MVSSASVKNYIYMYIYIYIHTHYTHTHIFTVSHYYFVSNDIFIVKCLQNVLIFGKKSD